MTLLPSPPLPYGSDQIDHDSPVAKRANQLNLDLELLYFFFDGFHSHLYTPNPALPLG